MPRLSRYTCLSAGLAVGLALSTPSFAAGKNVVAGTWIMVSAQADPNGENKPLFGAHPNGLLIFTADLHFADVLINPDVPKFTSGDRAEGTDAENKAVVARDLALYGVTGANSRANTILLRTNVALRTRYLPINQRRKRRGQLLSLSCCTCVPGNLPQLLYGIYTVDEQGNFATEHVIASIFPNWNGLERDTSTITETVEGDTMTERLQDPGGPQIVIVWKRAK